MRKLAWFSAGFGGACLLSCYGFGGWMAAVPAAVLCLVCMALWLYVRPNSNEDPYLMRKTAPKRKRLAYQLARRGLALGLGGVLAVLWFSAYLAVFYTPTLALAGNPSAELSGTVSTYPKETSIGGYSLTVRLDGGFSAPDVLVYGNEDWGGLEPGDRVTCTARVEGSTYLYGEETTYYTARGVYLLAYCNEAPEVEQADGVPFRYWPAVAGEKLRAGIYAAFDETVAPLAVAVTTGDKTGLNERFYSALNRSGVMHAAVVSGLHISVLVQMVLFFSRGRRKWALLAIPFLIFYALMAGGTPSAFRAVIMQAALLLAPVLRRVNDPPTALGFALMLLLVQNPMAAASVSLQLSFTSVAGLLLVAGPLTAWLVEPLSGLERRDSRLWRALLWFARFEASALAASLGAMLFTVPLIALYFGQVSLVAPLTNLLVLAVLSLLMVLALCIGTVTIVLPGAGCFLGMLVSPLGHYVLWVVTAVGSWTFSALRTGAYCAIALCGAYLCLALLPALCRRRRQELLCLLCVVGLLAASVGMGAATAAASDLTVTVLDVGQGSSTAFLSGNRAALVDCGGSQSDSAGDIAADYFASVGRGTLDVLVLTHYDEDHVNGLAQLFYRMRVAELWAPDAPSEAMDSVLALAEEAGAEIHLVREEQTLSFGAGELTLYPPLGGGASNESGLFVRCTAGEFDALITGDADSFVERMLVKYYDVPDIELYIVGHHGSKYSTGQELLDAFRPELAVISVGYNSYGHPAQETLDRLLDSGAEIYRTDLDGEVTVAVRDGQIAIS